MPTAPGLPRHCYFYFRDHFHHHPHAMPRPKPSLKARALSYLAAREHSRQELARKLARHAEEGDDVEALLDWLEAQKFLSEARFAESLVHRRSARFGSARILSELQSHGVDDSHLRELKAALRAGEEERAWQVWQRKYGEPPADAADVARLMRFLKQRGFSHAAITAVMRRAKARSRDSR
jgi:regulatory protein